MLIVLKKKFNSVDDAEAALGITLESYIDGSPDASISTTTTSTFEDELKLSPSLAGKLSALTPNQLIDLIFEGLALLKPHVDLAQLFVKFLDQVCVDALCTLEDLYAWLAKKMEVSSSVHGFIQLSLQAMKRLEVNGKSNLAIKFCQCLANDRQDKSGSLMPMHMQDAIWADSTLNCILYMNQCYAGNNFNFNFYCPFLIFCFVCMYNYN